MSTHTTHILQIIKLVFLETNNDAATRYQIETMVGHYCCCNEINNTSETISKNWLVIDDTVERIRYTVKPRASYSNPFAYTVEIEEL